MNNNIIPLPTQEQEYRDITIAHSELHSARLRLHRVIETVASEDPSQVQEDVSVILARLQVHAAEQVLNNLIRYYARIHPTPTLAPPPANPPPPANAIPVIEIEDSDDEESDNDAPAYSSWPPTPNHFYAALVDEPSTQALALPATLRCRPQDGRALSELPSTPSCAQPRREVPATPSTPSHVTSQTTTIVGKDGILTSPNPTQKHYIVTKGRRTGIYRAWAIAQAYTSSLGHQASWQGFESYSAAFDAYMGARERGLLRIVRLPEDSVEEFGAVDSAEDI